MNFKPSHLQIDEFELGNTTKEDIRSSISYHSNEKQLFTIKALPKKMIAITIMLTILGITFLIVGSMLIYKSPKKFTEYISLLVIGLLMIIPGVFYSIKLYTFTHSKSRAEQEQIIQELPIEY